MSARTLKFRRSDYTKEQLAFLECNAKIHAFVGGFGSGKTFAFLRKALWCLVMLKSKNGKSNGWVIYPTYSLAEELFVYPFMDLLESQKIKYEYNQSKHLFETALGLVRIFQLQKPARIIGTELTWVGFDEFDVESYKNCDMAFKKAIGRMRGCNNPQMFFVSTPEGNHYLYKIFVSDNQAGERRLFRAKTTDNPFLPSEYVGFLEENYDSRLLRAYRDGEFVSLTQGQIYHAFSEKNISEFKWHKTLPVVIMCDFNVGNKPMCWNIAQEDGETLNIRYALWKTHTNTYDMCEYLEAKLREHYGGELPYQLHLYGDYSGNTDRSNSTKSDWEIIEQHFSQLRVKTVKLTKPCRSVRNGVNGVNKRLESGYIKIWPGEDTRILREDLELVSWDQSGMREDQSNDMRSHSSAALRYWVDFEHPVVERRVH